MGRWNILKAAVVAAALVAASCSDDDNPTGPGGGGEEPKTGYTHFMPLSVGNKWTYTRIEKGSSSDPIETTIEYTVVSLLEDYHGYDAYLIREKIEKDPVVVYRVAGCDGDKCFLYICPWWEFLIEDDMAWQSFSHTGFYSPYQLQYNNIQNITVPAGTFNGCKQLNTVIYTSSSTSTSYTEYYARDVGLVDAIIYRDYGNNRWYSTEYQLTSYSVISPS
ncbi:MAG: hypothetical protein JSU81_06715 [Candidatus Coatesbacteria bacterium]|nr:MAG: hypothetical protein JSU81_06715 [Candidatus Coatesbacteria bacterium]